MKLEFIWDNDPPAHPPKSQIEDSIRFGLEHHPDPRGLKKEALTVYVKCTFMELGAQAVAYDDKDTPLFAATYSFSSGEGKCFYFDDPKRGEP